MLEYRITITEAISREIPLSDILQALHKEGIPIRVLGGNLGIPSTSFYRYMNNGVPYYKVSKVKYALQFSYGYKEIGLDVETKGSSTLSDEAVIFCVQKWIDERGDSAISKLENLLTNYKGGSHDC